MRKRMMMVVIAALSCVALMASGASAAPEFRSERVWAQCNGSTKVANVNLVADGVVPTWSTTAPTGSVQGGEGCGTVDLAGRGTNIRNIYDLVWSGTYTGNLNTMVVELHSLGQNPANSGDFAIRLYVDGDEVIPAGTQLSDLVPAASSTGASQSWRFGINQINEVDEIDGPGKKVHTIELGVSGWFTVNDAAIPFVWGTTEVPAGITFNGSTLGLPALNA